MTLFQDNLSPYLTVVEQGSTPANPAAGNQKLFARTSDHLLCYVNSSGTVTPVGGGMANPMTTKGDIILGDTGGTPTRLGAGTSAFVLTSNGAAAFPSWQAAGGGGTPILAITNYVRGTDGSLGILTGTTLTDFDAANAAVTFTAPASGNVLVQCQGLFDGSASAQVLWGLREGGSTVAGPYIIGVGPAINAAQRGSMDFYLTGVAGGSHTYKFAGKSGTAGQTTNLYSGPSFGPVVMLVIGMP